MDYTNIYIFIFSLLFGLVSTGLFIFIHNLIIGRD